MHARRAEKVAALERLLFTQAQWHREAAGFESPESFLASNRVHDMDCLVVDFHMPELDGLELTRLLVEMNHTTAIILVSAR